LTKSFRHPQKADVKTQQPLKPKITFGKFSNVDMRVAQVLSAPLTGETRSPCRVMELDLGPLGRLCSVGQLALVPEDQLVGRKVIACCNLGTRQMGSLTSEALVLGVPHPDSPDDQDQAMPLYVHESARCGDAVF
jgi:tRNA-binding protein